MPKQRNLLAGLFTMFLSLLIATPAFAAVYRQTDERYPTGEFMIIFESEKNGSYALGVDGNQWILRPLYDISAVANSDPRYLFRFEENPGDRKRKNNLRSWETNHSMAIKSKDGYLAFDTRGVDFFDAEPKISDTPEYRWQYIDDEHTDGDPYLMFKGSYSTSGKTAAIWAKANAEKTVIMLTRCGKGSSVYLYKKTNEDESIVECEGWQEYENGYNHTGWKYINADGTLKKNEWFTEDDKKYYFGYDGVTLIGYNRLPDEKFYYFRTDGSLLTDSEISIKSIPYRIDENGVCHKIPDSDPTRTSNKVLQTAQDDEALNWINLKRSELGLNPLHRDNRLAAIAEKIAIQEDQSIDSSNLSKMGIAQGIQFSQLGSLRISWNKNTDRLSLEHYYNSGVLGAVVDDSRLNHIGIFSRAKKSGNTRDVIIVVGAY